MQLLTWRALIQTHDFRMKVEIMWKSILIMTLLGAVYGRGLLRQETTQELETSMSNIERLMDGNTYTKQLTDYVGHRYKRREPQAVPLYLEPSTVPCPHNTIRITIKHKVKCVPVPKTEPPPDYYDFNQKNYNL